MGSDILVVGIKGSGKNTIIAIIETKIKKKPIYSTFKLDHPMYKPLSLVGMLNLPSKVLLNIDEAYTWLESRHSSKYTNIYLSHVNLQLRKSDRDIFITAQMLSSIDKRFREHYDYMVHCSRMPNENKDWRKWDFLFIFKNNITGQISPMGLKYEDAKPYFKLFDTYEIQEAPAKSRMIFELLKTEPDRLLSESIRFANIIKSDFDTKKYPNITPTKDLVTASLMRHKIDAIWTKNVHLILNNYDYIREWIKNK